MKKLKIYNLEFPEYIFELNIGGYKFTRVEEYGERFALLQHVFTKIGGEFIQNKNVGIHQITAEVEIPDNEEISALPWESDKKVTKLQDVIFLLTMFTERNVFISYNEKILPISVDSRCHFRGGDPNGFRSYINHDYKHKNKKTGVIVSNINGKLSSDYVNIDLGFEKTLNNVLNLVHSKIWLNEFKQGFFLFLFQEIMGQIYITSSFLYCWTICEHLFALHNTNLSDKDIYNTNGVIKISYIYQRYFPNSKKSKEEFKKIVLIRNRLIHYGKVPDKTDLKEMAIFIKMTEKMIAIILGLKNI